MTTTQHHARQIVLADGAEALAHSAAQRLLASMARNAERIAVCLTGGTTAPLLYDTLRAPVLRDAIPWRRTHWFVGDERFVPLDDPRSNMGTARRLLLDPCGAPAANIHAVPTDAFSPQEAARRYETVLMDFYGATVLDPARPLFDVVFMGLGADGHTASLFPGLPDVDETTHWTRGIAQAPLEPFVPRVSLTLPALASSREMLFMVAGAGKRDILARALRDASLPAARARSEGALVWLVDRAAMPDANGAGI